jgi:hypothetical protein
MRSDDRAVSDPRVFRLITKINMLSLKTANSLGLVMESHYFL